MLREFLAAHAAELSELQAAHAVELNQDGTPPEWVQLLPAGHFAGRDGRGPYDNKDSGAVIAATQSYQGGADFPSYYDHQDIWTRENGQPAVASGWVKEFQARPDGVWGRTEWTPQAVQHLKDREFRYLSPVFTHAKDGTVLRLVSMSLVNNPNLELTAVASQLPQGDSAVKLEDLLKKLAAIFGLGESSTAETVAAHAQKVMDGVARVAKILGLPEERDVEKVAAHAQTFMTGTFNELLNLAKAVGAPESATAEQLVAHAQKLLKSGEVKANGSPDLKDWVPMSQFTAVNDRLKVLEGERVADLVDEAIKTGKIPPANKAWGTAYCSQDEAGFKKMLAGMPAILKFGESGPAGAPPSDGLDAEEVAVCSALGIKKDDYLKLRKEEKGQGGDR